MQCIVDKMIIIMKFWFQVNIFEAGSGFLIYLNKPFTSAINV